MWREAMRMLWMFHLFLVIAGQDSCVVEDVEVWKFRHGEPANLTVLGDTDNGCKFVLQTDKDRTCCYMNDTRQKYNDGEYNICGVQQSEDCISKSRFGVSEPKGQGKCILTLNNFQESDAGRYNVEFPNERRKMNRIKKIEILDHKYEIKEIVVGQTAITVFKGDIKDKGCRFEAHLSSRICCYEDKLRKSCKPEHNCTEYRDNTTYEVQEDGNKCVLYLMNFQTSDVGEYEVIFPGDKHDNEKFMVKEAEKTNWSAVWGTVIPIAVLVILIVVVVGVRNKYKLSKRLEDGKLAEGSNIFEALHKLNSDLFTKLLGDRSILKVKDSNKNNLFHKVADKNWSPAMTSFLNRHCKNIFEQPNEDSQNIQLNIYNERQQIFCAKTVITRKHQIIRWITEVLGHGKMKQVWQVMFPITYIDLNSQNDSGKTPLHIAAEKNELNIVKVLLSNGANPNIEDKHQSQPLQQAILNQQCDGNRKPDNIEMVEVLLTKQANPMSKLANGQNILHSAVMKNNLDVIKLILEKTNSNEQKQLLQERYSKEETDRKTKLKNTQWAAKTPMELAAKFGHREVVEYFVNKDKLWNTENGGMQVIYSAVSSSHKNIVDHLLQHGGIFNPNWVINNMEEGDNILKKLIRDKNHAAVNILIDSTIVKFEDQHLNEAMKFAKAEEDKIKDEETDNDSSNKKNRNNKSSKEKIENIIKALERKKKNMTDEEIDFEKKKLQKDKKEIEGHIKTIEKESEDVKENYRRKSIDLLRQRKAEIVIELRNFKEPKEDKSPSIPPSIETLELRLRNIQSNESTLSQKKIKQILQLMEETLPLKRDKAT